MRILEFRIPLPMTVAEYELAQLWSVNEASKEQTGGGDGIEVIENEPFEDTPIWRSPQGVEYNKGQLTVKRYYLRSKAPAVIKKLFSDEALQLDEQAWNCFPYCRTVFTNPGYMKGNLELSVETIHLDDRGTTENAHNLSGEELAKREIVNIDIANDPVQAKDYHERYDPKLIASAKTNRGPLKTADWNQTCEPVMCCYKLVKFKFKWFGMQTLVEHSYRDTQRRIFFLFHRQVYCWIDKWHGVSMEEIRAIEAETKAILDKQRGEEGERGYGGD